MNAAPRPAPPRPPKRRDELLVFSRRGDVGRCVAITSSLLSANELMLSFGHQNLIEGVTLTVAPGEKVGLVGRIGCGKTTLLKILAGDMHADSGDILTTSHLL